MKRTAIISPCGLYRYRLDREFDKTRERVVFVMCNPSTADAEDDDPTVRKCIGFARLSSYGIVTVVNPYAFRATDAKQLRTAADPIGPENDRYIEQAASGAAAIVCAWGGSIRNAPGWRARVHAVTELLAKHGPLLSIRTAKSGLPVHPLMEPYGPFIPLGTPC